MRDECQTNSELNRVGRSRQNVDSTPIEFEEVWDLDGSSHRGAAKQRLEVVFGDLHKYGLANNFELVEIFTDSEPGKRGPKSTTYLMSYNVFKHYIS